MTDLYGGPFVGTFCRSKSKYCRNICRAKTFEGIFVGLKVIRQTSCRDICRSKDKYDAPFVGILVGLYCGLFVGAFVCTYGGSYDGIFVGLVISMVDLLQEHL